ncbi:MAG: HNH endonuclease [Deltaproteobacteria bacterium]|nr:HNH endonuclease [Deltaproteobacteria bacterium]
MKGSVKTKSKPESKQAESKQKEKKPKAAKRNRVTKTIRFEVFKRDGFTCTYCGKSPPEVELEVDHIDPHSQGGDDGIENYTTACFDCNRGKDDKPLDGLPQSILSKREDAEEKKRQVEELIKLSGFEPFGTLLEAQKHKETYTGYLKQLEFDEKKGNLLNADDVKKDAEKAARIVKERVTAWPGRTAPLVAPITDEFEVEQVLKLECDRLLEEISKAVVDESL